MKCNYCENQSIFHKDYSGEDLCVECFNKSLERQIARTISKFKMLKPTDKVIVGLSGGKDSIVLLFNLLKIQKKVHKSPPLIALTINEGISNYREISIRKAANFCEENNVDHEIISFKEILGKNLEEILEIYKIKYREIYPCNICATIRRRLLNDEGKRLGGSVLALGHNLDDVTQTYMMNILRKDFSKISRMSPVTEAKNGFFLKKIKPLMRIPENEIQFYAQNTKLDFLDKPCPYKVEYPILRKRVQSFLNEFEEYSPEIKFNLFHGFIELSGILSEYNTKLKETTSTLNQCKICQMPCGNNRDICLYCEIKNKIG